MIKFYSNIKEYIDIIKDIVFIIGVLSAFFAAKNYFFNKKKEEIANNLQIRKDIKEKLLEFVNGYDRSTPRSIGIRLVSWKNYPWKLDNDGYKQILYYDVNMDKICHPGANFLSNTGIILEEDLWRSANTVYIGKNEIYIIDKKNKKIRGFDEIKQDLKIVKTLKYKHIVNFDFEEKIEYEPVFYTRYKYNKQKLYENDFFIENFYGIRMPAPNNRTYGTYFRQPLNRKNMVSSNMSIKYFYLIIKYILKK